MDQSIRNKLRSVVTQCRKLLEEAVRQVLQGQFGIYETGKKDEVHVEDETRMKNLSDEDKGYRRDIQAHLGHIEALGYTAKDALAQLVREIAFTHLNRLSAYKMMEARSVWIGCKPFRESVSRGMKSQGFQFYLADHAEDKTLFDTGHQDVAYRHFLSWLGATMSEEIGVLFSPTDPANRLFPPQRVLDDVLALLNSDDLKDIWCVDETIGWVYQYFTPKELRDQVRKESAAPRNSYELAFRNQFFTPRYVVEFLTDNTLGRIWYEMRMGQTTLTESCRYLVRRPDEVFLAQSTCEEHEHFQEDCGAIAKLLLSGDEGTFPEFSSDKDDDIQRMISLSHCVSTYQRLGDDCWPLRDRLEPAITRGELENVSTQEILEFLFQSCRSDRHGGDGSVYKETWFVAAANEVRRRVLKARQDDISQEELLTCPIFVPYRLKKDPRELRILDPACGSGHFLLHCFDLLLTIYEEAYVDPDLGAKLREDYPTLEALRRDAPRLILAHNLHGIDIDLRASQIAALALWLRCQRAYREMGFKDDRPKITKSNFVCAEPMPGEKEMLREFVADLQPKVLGHLVEIVFDKMKLAGETGSLLKIEEELRDAIAGLKRKWIEETEQATDRKGQPLLFTVAEMDRLSKKTTQLFDFSEITDEQFWNKAEGRVLAALRSYAVHASSSGTLNRQLFAEDTERGFAFIDLCQKLYDVVLMNPPFGECIEASKDYLRPIYPNAISDIGLMFVSHGVGMLSEKGLLGAITNRTCLATSQLEDWRREIPLGRAPISVIADLGYGVLDTAKVEAAAYVLRNSSTYGEVTGLRLLDSLDKGPSLLKLITAARDQTFDVRTQMTRHSVCLTLPLAAIVYWAPLEITQLMTPGRRLRDFAPAANDGGHTGDDFRFVRSAWEIPAEWIGESERFVFFAKGGEYAPFWDDFHLVVKWEQNGAEIRKIPGARIYHEDLYFKPGLTYPLRTTSDFSPRILPKGVLFSTGGHGIHFLAENDALVFLSLAYTRFVKVCVEILFGGGDASIPGTMARNYTAGTMSQLPYPKVRDRQEFGLRTVKLVGLFRKAFTTDETSRTFSTLPISSHAISLREGIWKSLAASIERLADISLLMKQVESESAEAFGVQGNVDATLDYIYGKHPCFYPERDVAVDLQNLLELSLSELVKAAGESTGGRNRSITMKSFFVDRRVDLYSHTLKAHPSSICRAWTQLGVVPQSVAVDTASSLISIGIGCVFGRWDVQKLCTEEQTSSDAVDPFVCLTRCPPATLTDDAGLPAHKLTTDYKLVVQWDGIIADDPDYTDDIVRRVREVFELIWKDRADTIENEACEILGAKELRDYFRKPGKGGFWDDHVSRYSKSRRKAPIYWLLQSSKKSYGLWLYYHRLDKDILFKAIQPGGPVQTKINLEQTRLDSLRSQKSALGADAKGAKKIDKDIERQETLLGELKDFAEKLERAAKLNFGTPENLNSDVTYEPDLNDGVVLNIAPLWELVPWKEAKNYWEELLEGKYEWSSMGKLLRKKGLVT